MPLDVEFQGNPEEVDYMRRCIFPPSFQNGHANNNHFLETIILGQSENFYRIGNSYMQMSQDNIGLIARPHIHDGHKVVANKYGEFSCPINGEFVIELRPKGKNINIKGVPNGVVFCKANYDKSVIFMYGFREGFTEKSTNVTIQMFYSNNDSESITYANPPMW
jgi:hypothetical protein